MRTDKRNQILGVGAMQRAQCRRITLTRALAKKLRAQLKVFECARNDFFCGFSARQLSEGSIVLHAAISPFTASIDLANIAFSASSIGNSMMRSTPPAPITQGTPT